MPTRQLEHHPRRLALVARIRTHGARHIPPTDDVHSIYLLSLTRDELACLSLYERFPALIDDVRGDSAQVADAHGFQRVHAAQRARERVYARLVVLAHETRVSGEVKHPEDHVTVRGDGLVRILGVRHALFVEAHSVAAFAIRSHLDGFLLLRILVSLVLDPRDVVAPRESATLYGIKRTQRILVVLRHDDIAVVHSFPVHGLRDFVQNRIRDADK